MSNAIELNSYETEFLAAATDYNHERAWLGLAHVIEYNGQRLIVTLDGFRLHAIKAEDAVLGSYAIMESAEVLYPVQDALNENLRLRINDVIPNTDGWRSLKKVTEFNHQDDEEEILLYSNRASVQKRFVEDVELYGNVYTVRGCKDVHKPLYYDFGNGCFAVIMPTWFPGEKESA